MTKQDITHSLTIGDGEGRLLTLGVRCVSAQVVLNVATPLEGILLGVEARVALYAELRAGRGDRRRDDTAERAGECLEVTGGGRSRGCSRGGCGGSSRGGRGCSSRGGCGGGSCAGGGGRGGDGGSGAVALRRQACRRSGRGRRVRTDSSEISLNKTRRSD